MKIAPSHLLLLCFIVPQLLQAQTIEKYYDFEWKPVAEKMARFRTVINKTDSGYVRKDYFIRENRLQMSGKYADKDCEIPDGYFRSYYYNGQIESVGKYIDGKKEGLWLRYYINGKKSDSAVYRAGKLSGIGLSWHNNSLLSDSVSMNDDGSGFEAAWFDNGSPSYTGSYITGNEKDGKWIYYHKNGLPSLSQTYSQGFLVDKKYFDEKGKPQAKVKVENRDAEFVGGKDAWLSYLDRRIYFPQDYELVNTDSAIVVISFTVDENGDMAETFVHTPFHPVFDRIAEKAVRTSPRWRPAIDHNRRVKFKGYHSVNFYEIDPNAVTQ